MRLAAAGMAMLYYCTSRERDAERSTFNLANRALHEFALQAFDRKVEEENGLIHVLSPRTSITGNNWRWTGTLCLLILLLCACDVQRRKSDAELGLTPQQSAGRKLYDQHCDRCHEPYSSRDKKGRSLQGVFKKPFLSQSGMPANDERVGEMILTGRNMMPAFGQVMSKQQVQNILAYLHTL
jgi:cytochrome c5